MVVVVVVVAVAAVAVAAAVVVALVVAIVVAIVRDALMVYQRKVYGKFGERARRGKRSAP